MRPPTTDLQTYRPRWPIFAYFGVFVGCGIGSWGWFNTDIGRSTSHISTPNSRPRLWLQARTNIPGYVFTPESVSDEVKKILGTTNILSGTFYRITEDRNQKPALSSDIQPLTSGNSLDSRPLVAPERGEGGSPLDHASRFTVFLATWHKTDKHGMVMIQHTPDICWDLAGWKPVNQKQLSELYLRIPFAKNLSSNQNSTVQSMSAGLDSGLNLPLTSRVFEFPIDHRRELAIWCSLVGGCTLTEQTGWNSETNRMNTKSLLVQSRLLILKQLSDATKLRLPSRGTKQFVRYSLPVTHDWETTLRNAESLGRAWLVSDKPEERGVW